MSDHRPAALTVAEEALAETAPPASAQVPSSSEERSPHWTSWIAARNLRADVECSTAAVALGAAPSAAGREETPARSGWTEPPPCGPESITPSLRFREVFLFL